MDFLSAGAKKEAVSGGLTVLLFLFCSIDSSLCLTCNFP